MSLRYAAAPPDEWTEELDGDGEVTLEDDMSNVELGLAETNPKFPPMDPALKAEWLKALRSGKYEQARETLRDTSVRSCPAFCCLGVLCDLYDSKAWKVADSAMSYSRWEYDDDDETGELPDTFRERVARLSDPAETHLIRMNDAGKSFDEIADFIEANL